MSSVVVGTPTRTDVCWLAEDCVSVLLLKSASEVMAEWSVKSEMEIKQEQEDFDLPPVLSLKTLPPPLPPPPPPPAVVSSSTASPPAATCMRPPPPPGPPRQRPVTSAYVEVKQERNGQEEPSSSIPDLGELT